MGVDEGNAIGPSGDRNAPSPLRGRVRHPLLALRGNKRRAPDRGPALSEEANWRELLQYNLVVFFEALENFGTGAVGDSDLDRRLLLAVLGARVGDLD